MKQYFYLSGMLFFFACTNRTAEKEEVFIRSRISLHNDFFETFSADSIKRRDNIWDSIYHPGESQYKVERLTDSIISILYKKSNAPYNPDLDHHLTYTKFMDYCLGHNIDPVRLATTLKVE